MFRVALELQITFFVEVHYWKGQMEYCLLTSSEEVYYEDDRRQFFRNNKVR